MNIAKPWYASSARTLLANRREGFTPDSPINVSLMGGEFDDIALFVRPDMPVEMLDWRMLVNLDVHLWANPTVAIGKVLATASRIAHARPKELVLRFEQANHIHDIEVGSATHRPAIADIPAEHTFTWMPINLGGTPLGKRLRDALRTAHKPWSTL